MNKKAKQKISLSVMLLMATGCSAMDMNVKPVATEPDIVSVRLAQASEKAAKALDTLSNIEQYREPQMPPPIDYSAAPATLTQPITVTWAGPIEQIVETLAARTGMRYVTSGARSGATIVVSIDVYQKPLIEVLHDIGLQAGRRADVSINNTNNTIEIRYASVDRI